MKVGINLAPDFCSAAIVNVFGLPDMVKPLSWEQRESKRRKPITPTAVSFMGNFVYVGEQALAMSALDTRCSFYQDPIGGNNTATPLSQDGGDSLEWAPEDFAAILLKKIKTDVEAREYGEVEGGVLCYSSGRDSLPGEDLLKASWLAGYPRMELLAIPKAILYACTHLNGISHEESVGVIHIGKSTSMVSLLQRKGSQWEFTAPEREIEFGSNLFKNAVRQLIHEQGMEFENQFSLRQFADHTLARLTADFIPLTESVLTIGDASMIVQLGRKSLEYFLEEEFNSLIDQVKAYFYDLGLCPGELCRLILNGEEAIAKITRDQLLKDPELASPQLLSMSPDHAAAKGAAVYSSLSSNPSPKLEKPAETFDDGRKDRKMIRVATGRAPRNPSFLELKKKKEIIDELIINNIV